MSAAKSIGQVEVSFSFARHVGPRYVHGAVTLQFDGSRSYSFSSNASWPEGDNYEEAIRVAIEETLRTVQGHLNAPSVSLIGIEWNDVSSCQSGFESAAKAATRAVFEV